MWLGWLRIGCSNNFTEQQTRWIGEIVFLQYGLEGNAFAMIPKFATIKVERSLAKLACLGFDFVRREENKLSLWIDELLDEPRTRDSVHLHFFARDPFHRDSSFICVIG